MERLIMFHLVFIFDWISVILLGMTMFRYPIRQYWLNIMISSLIMTSCSYIIRDIIGLVKISPAIQIVILIMLFMALFKIRFLYSSLIVSFGYLGYLFVQFIMLIFTKAISFQPSGKLLESYNYVYVLVTLTNIVLFIVIGLLNKFRIGFTYDPARDTQFNTKHKLILCGFLFWSVILLGAVLYLAELNFFQLVFILSVLTLYYLFDFVLKREQAVTSRKAILEE